MQKLTQTETHDRVAKLITFYETLTPGSIKDFSSLYSTSARFKDPFNDVQGLPSIEKIFTHMFNQVGTPAFNVIRTICGESEAMLFWEFHFRFKGIPCKKLQRLEGVTHLVLEPTGLVGIHRDYWDAAEELYSRLPVLGMLMRGLQRMLRA